ncbi:hypothetical protein A7A08_00557 [Methyloligella halotolerans]|uniref:Peptidase inhibitor family I36 n=1 Tax=Methyloligella halotolerans TaxID=1177755 RepID=A0A1E2S317_9HYPH|nr:hypothetical protein [Methyloligella halotolerans]ODA68725.1 hypothetical protein A7A08_00557 [Methyloligella halotolerans]
MLKAVIFGALGLLGLAIIATSSAQAAVVCNGAGDCWRVKKQHTYPDAARVHIYGDDWAWDEAEADRYRWRDPGEGRGYYDGSGVWITF